MDALTTARPAPLPAALPPAAPLAMPEQSLSAWGVNTVRERLRPDVWTTPWLARFVAFGGMLLLTGFGAYQMYRVVDAGGVTMLEWVFLILFVINFSWIALAFSSSLVGLAYILRHGLEREPVLPETLAAKNVVVMPIYNESPARVFATLEAIALDVYATGHGESFEFFFLSDTTDPDIWIAEEKAFLTFRERCPQINVFYRHRPKNTARKAGNIGEFVTSWGGRYAHMIVLDADSLMTGKTIVALAAAMEADPDSGIIQTLPRLINRNTLIARIQQFAARIYGPIVAAGLASWSGRDGNYWGHNAIIRMEAFAGAAGLPHLAGKPPFGGHVLSHDFIEAALIRRAGWSVYMLPFLGGSFEESPPSLMDLAIRDRRWCQGNLQHSRIVGAAGLSGPTRQHLITGIMSYVASPLWLVQLLVGLMLALQAAFIRPEYFTSEFSLFPAWPIFDSERALNLFIITMAVLLLPKGLGLLTALFHGPTRRGSGGVIALVASTVLEIALSVLLAPVMMVIQSSSVFAILSGRDSGWKPQRRDDGSIPFKSIVERHWRHTAFGIVAAISAFAISEAIFWWMSPTIIGLLLAVPTSWASASAGIGFGLRHLHLLQIPEESSPPPLAEKAFQTFKLYEELGLETQSALAAVHGEEAFREHHKAIIQAPPKHVRGRIDSERAMAEAKLNDAETLAEAQKWLSSREVIVVLHDRALIALLSSLTVEPKAE
jgi:membrane glycosyltransferase